VVDTPIRDRRAERREATRAEILDAAWAQVRSEGLAALSLRDLAAAVGMRPPSLYSYFESKNAIYDAMFAQAAQQFLDDKVFTESPLSGDPLADLQAGMRSFARFCTDDPARYQLLFQRTIPGFEPSPESFALSVQALERTAQRLAEIGIADPADIDLLTALGTGLTDQQMSNDPGGDRWLRLVDDAMAMYFHHVSGRRAAPAGRGRQ
jgi:AcrR family transcriptional regulator